MTKTTIQQKITGKILPIFLLLVLAVSLLSTASAAVPNPPVSLNAISADTNTIEIRWSGVADADEYNVYRAESQNGPFMQVGTSGSTGYIDTGLRSGTTYYYKVAANNGDGESDFAGPVSATTKSMVPYNVNAQAVSMSEIAVSWDAVQGAPSYLLYRSLSPQGTYTLVTATTSTMFRDTGLQEDTTYYYRVQVGNYQNTYGPLSDYVSATTMKAPKLVITASALSSSEIKVEWTAVPGASNYHIYRSTYNGGYAYVATTVDLEWTNNGLSPSTIYWYKVVASNGADNSTYAKTHDQVPVLTATPIDTQTVQLDWTGVMNADRYKIYRSLSENGPFEEVGAVEYATTFTDMSLDHTTTYYYYVVAWSGSFEGASSNIASAKTMTPVIGVPDVEAEALNTTGIKVTWNEIGGAYDYNIYRSLTEDGVYEKIGDTEDLEFTDKNLAHTTTYYYKVAVYTGQDMGEQSAPANATTKTPEKETNPGNNGGAKVNKPDGSVIPGFESPVEVEVIPQDEIKTGFGGFVFPLFLLLAVLTAGVLYAREKRRQNKIE